ALYSRRLDGRPDFWLWVGGKAISLVAAVAVAATTRSYWAIAVATVTPWFVSAAGSYFFAPYLPRLRLSERRFFYHFVGGMTSTQFFSALLWQFDKLFLGRLVSNETLGRFYMAGNVANLPFQVIGGPIIRPFSAALAISHARNSLAAAFQKSTRAVCLVMAPHIVIIALLSNAIITLLLGDGWKDAAQWLTFLALASLPGLPIQTLAPLCIALNRTGALAVRTGTELALYVPMVIVGYLSIGIPGVIGARLLSLLVSAAISMFLVRSLLKLRIRDQLANLVSPIIASFALAVVLTFLTAAIPTPTGRGALVAYIGGLGTIGMLIYALAAVALWNAAGRPDGVERVAAGILIGLGRRAKSIAPLRG
ncbi:MAG: oligosaccharide flippase family protein, partial [Acetobacteraceae bacterium]|nr:oligosaccharide flippase family protein [Acetobacteraceae bacterium]